MRLAILVACLLPTLAIADTPPRIEAPLTETRGDGWRGVNLYAGDAGCTDCHTNPDVAAMGPGGDLGPEVGLLGALYDRAELRAILVDARSVFGDETAMPAFGADGLLSPQDIEDLVAYLSELQPR
ncbi:c-type cytochrome [Pontivivens ytuae]|uniref:C-type cytochrome n=1 Tax=Pontivivens ytuae TaxID=2789856 RepID=A0A7S9LS22_9RHOB|nr:c-type cytochrome [Pontivivens ytuae]QPH54249.1 c-type cytochrome [Pontivivens ytuae]